MVRERQQALRLIVEEVVGGRDRALDAEIELGVRLQSLGRHPE